MPSGDEALPEGARAFLSAMRRRYACKLFDRDIPVARELVDYLVECIRLSPSSFGLEPTHVVAALGSELRAELAASSGGQDPMATAPLIFLLVAPREMAYSPDSEFVRSRAERFPGGLSAFKADYEGYYGFLRAGLRLEPWARAQSYIALANAMTGAAAAGLDSCAIEGFDEPLALAAAGLDGSSWMACVMAAFGYRAEGRRERFRLSAVEMSELRE
jgi:nitroreductase